MSQKILIKDPYLNSTYKSQVPEKYHQFQKQRLYQHPAQDEFPLRKIDHELRHELERTQNEYKRMTKAFNQENRLNRKILDFQAVNNEYHEALKIRNFDLNNKLADLNTQNHLLSTKFQSDQYRNYHQKDVIIKKYETQAEELLQARKTINNLLENKTRLQQQLQQLTFFLDTQTERFNLQMREQMIRMEGLQRSLKNLAEIKDQQINQLRNRIRIYEDQNKRLNEENRSLHTNLSQRDKENKGGLQNLSQINYMDSQMKDPTIQKQLQEQKNLNDKLIKQMEDMKRKLFTIEEEQNKRKEVSQKKKTEVGQKQQSNSLKKLETDKVEGIIGSINTLRNGVNKQIFQIFYKSVKDGQKHRSNSLVIFIQNWKNIDLNRILPYIQSYMQSRSTLKQICLSNKYQGKPIHIKMEECIPLHIALKKGRNEINSWILSTIQLTKNQRESSKKSMNNLLLFLFRLLTIQYRITYPMQGKSYSIDEDVKNELGHQIIKAIQYIIDFK